ncbi:MAG: hypothetical protein ABIH21_04805 [Patescibacteria group bacterium]
MRSFYTILVLAGFLLTPAVAFAWIDCELNDIRCSEGTSCQWDAHNSISRCLPEEKPAQPAFQAVRDDGTSKMTSYDECMLTLYVGGSPFTQDSTHTVQMRKAICDRAFSGCASAQAKEKEWCAKANATCRLAEMAMEYLEACGKAQASVKNLCTRELPKPKIKKPDFAQTKEAPK